MLSWLMDGFESEHQYHSSRREQYKKQKVPVFADITRRTDGIVIMEGVLNLPHAKAPRTQRKYKNISIA